MQVFTVLKVALVQTKPGYPSVGSQTKYRLMGAVLLLFRQLPKVGI